MTVAEYVALEPIGVVLGLDELSRDLDRVRGGSAQSER